MVPIKNFMTPSPVTIDPEATLQTALALMNEHGFGHLPVMEEGRLVGLISFHELEYAAPHHLQSVMSVRKALKGDAYTVGEGTPAAEVARTMAEQQLESAVVVSEGGKPIGIVTTADLLKSFSETVEKISPDEVPHR